MIQEIAPHQLMNEFHAQAPEPSDYVFCFQDGKVLLLCNQIPTVSQILCEDYIWLFRLDDKNVFLGEHCMDDKKFEAAELSVLRHFKPSHLGFAGMTAKHLYDFYAKNRYCGRCREILEFSKKERAMVCTHCGNTIYPSISPAVIVGIVDEDRILLTKYNENHSNYRKYALVAGYTEIGETLEETVKREVYEEVGLKVKDITYYKNQPWGFSSSLLVGFFAKVDGSTEIHREKEELDVAKWVSREEMEESEDTISLTREMMEVFRKNEINWRKL